MKVNGAQGEADWEFCDLGVVLIIFWGSKMLLACWRASKWFQSKPVIQFCVICMANVVGKCCLSATPGRCWYTSVVWGTWHYFCPAPAGGVTHPQVCHCCKWGLRKRSFSLLPVTEILPPGHTVNPHLLDLQTLLVHEAWGFSPPSRPGQVLFPWWVHQGGTGDSEHVH